MSFPVHRPRRLRKTELLRTLVRETRLGAAGFVYPLFVCPGSAVRQEVGSMPGVFQQSADKIVEDCREVEALGISGVILFGLPESKLAWGGLSQGTMMSLHAGLRRKVAPKAIVGYSGMLVMPENVEPDAFAAEIRSRPPVLLIHGDADQLIPVQALFHAAQGLAALDVPAEWHISAGIGHGIDQEGLRQGGEFLARSFARRK